MNGFKERLRLAINSSSESSLRQISIKSGFAETHLANLLNNPDLERSTSGPGFFGIVRLCKVLGITPNFLADMSDINISRHEPSLDSRAVEFARYMSDLMTAEGSRPTEGQLLSAYVQGGARVEAFRPFMDYCDLLEAPSSGRILNIIHVAPRGLTAAALGSTDADIVNKALETAGDPKFVENMRAAHREAEEKGYLVTIEDINVDAKSLARRVRAQYVRCLLAVKDAEGNKLIVNHAKPLS